MMGFGCRGDVGHHGVIGLEAPPGDLDPPL
jgi:hypothetical protein